MFIQPIQQIPERKKCRMVLAIRIVLVIVGLLMFPLAWGFATGADWATMWWLWVDTPLSYRFIGAMQAAIGVAMIWIGLTNALHMLVAGGLNLFVMLTGIAIYLFSGQEPLTPTMRTLGIGSALFALFNLWLVFWAQRFVPTDPRPMPWGLRICFMIFVAALLAVGGALVTQQKGIFPWPLSTGTSAVFGWMFLGDAFYFLYALFRPRWVNAAPQLWSFLAYDLVLIPPFINLLGAPRVIVEDGALPYELLQYNLVVYLGILFFSAMVAIYSLFIDARTRVWS
jgi:hypothetical protein